MYFSISINLGGYLDSLNIAVDDVTGANLDPELVKAGRKLEMELRRSVKERTRMSLFLECPKNQIGLF